MRTGVWGSAPAAPNESVAFCGIFSCEDGTHVTFHRRHQIDGRCFRAHLHSLFLIPLWGKGISDIPVLNEAYRRPFPWDEKRKADGSL